MKFLTSSNVFWNWRTSCTNKKGRYLFERRDLFILAKMMDGIGSPWIKNLNAEWKRPHLSLLLRSVESGLGL